MTKIKLIIFALIVGLLFLTGWVSRGWYADSKNADDRIAAAESKIEKQAEQHAITQRVVTEYVDRIVYVKGKTNEVVKEIPVYIPADSMLPGGFRLLHDAAVRSEFPESARSADASPVNTQDVARTVAENYGTCNEFREQLVSLQDWVRRQQGLNKEKVKR